MTYEKPEVHELGNAALVIQSTKDLIANGDGPFTTEVGAYNTEE